MIKCGACTEANREAADLGAGARPRVHYSADGRTRVVMQMCIAGCGTLIRREERGRHRPDGSWEKEQG